MNFSRLLSHPLVVAGLQSGAVFTKNMREEDERQQKFAEDLARQSYTHRLDQEDKDASNKQTRYQALEGAWQRSTSLPEYEAALAAMEAEGHPQTQIYRQQTEAIKTGKASEAAAKGSVDQQKQMDDDFRADIQGASQFSQAAQKKQYFTDLKKKWTGTPFEARLEPYINASSIEEKQETGNQKEKQLDDQAEQEAIGILSNSLTGKLPKDQQLRLLSKDSQRKPAFDIIIKGLPNPEQSFVEKGVGEELGYAEDTTTKGVRVIADKYRNAYGAMNQPPAPKGNVGPYASGYRTGQPPAPSAVEGGPPAGALAYLRDQGLAGGSSPAAPPVGTLPAAPVPPRVLSPEIEQKVKAIMMGLNQKTGKAYTREEAIAIVDSLLAR